MVDRRPISWTSLALALVLSLLAPACQSAMSIEEAKKVSATFGGAAFVPPPRTINDITAILDQQKRTTPEVVAREQADEAPPGTTDRDTLAAFYFKRGLAAGEIGRTQQEIADLTKAAEYAGPRGSPDIYKMLSYAESHGGNFSRAVEYRRKAIEAGQSPSWQLLFYSNLVLGEAGRGDVKAAEAALAEASRLYYLLQSRSLPSYPESQRHANFLHAQAMLSEVTGKYAEAEALYRRAEALLASDPEKAGGVWLDRVRGRLAETLTRQGRLLEAENEARKALLGALAKRGRYSAHTALVLRPLVGVLLEQGRYRESEALARAAIDIYVGIGAAWESLEFARAREQLAITLELQGRYREALVEYEAIHDGLSGDPESLKRFPGGLVGYAEVLLRTGHGDRALERFVVALEQHKRLMGGAHRSTAGIRGALARAYAATGDTARALREFREATPLLLMRSPNGDDEATRPLADHRLFVTLSSYIGLLADITGTPLAREAGIDAAAEAFRLADVARGRSVQRALNASAARASAQSPALADLVRREQDVRKQINALYGLLANLLSQPSDQQDPKVVADLRSRIDTLQRALEMLTAQIEKDFPAYAELIDPKPVTVDRARAMLRPAEALIATLVTQDRTFVWAVPQSGPVAFTAVSIGAEEVKRTVASLRTSLEPRAETLGDIPDFDLTLAHRLYSTLLDPVRSAWQDARSLLVVAHGPLGQLPLALLPTRPTTLSLESGPIFSNYRGVPWLVRHHAVTMLPSVTSLATLRTIPPGDSSRRPFIGFGDPYFSREQARLAEEEQARAIAQEQPSVATVSDPKPTQRLLATRAVPVTFRSSPQAFDSSQLARLPRLPETAEEIRSLAGAMNADLARDVFLGARANEKTVKTHDLTRYRVVAFASHGLVPGDLDGLTQPALALSAPDVADVEGDGLLTMDEILALRLNADWVVLSACNTASGQGAGSEAVSGLGRAFFYAGARALLVSNWPVETTSARALTMDLFRRQQENPGVNRAEALQETMNWLIDQGELIDVASGRTIFSYAHPVFWAPFTLIGDGGSGVSGK
jgi:CHAT domain-containing protein